MAEPDGKGFTNILLVPRGIANQDDRLRAQMVAAVYLANLFLSVSAGLFVFLDSSALALRILPTVLVTLITNLSFYLLARTRWYRWAGGALLVTIPLFVILMILLLNTTPVFFVASAWLLIGIGVGTFVFGPGIILLVLAANLMIPLVLAPLVGIHLIETIGLELFLATGTVLLLVHNWFNRRIEQDAAEIQIHLEEELQEAQKLKAVGQLAGGVAHDFNNLLLGINGLADLGLMNEAENHSAKQELEEIQQVVQRASELTRSLLAFSRNQVLVCRPLDLNEIVASVGKLARRVIGENITLNQAPAKGLPPVDADPAQLEQVLMNLVINARDAMPEGGVLTIETGQADIGPGSVARPVDMAPGRYAFLTVSDTGCGMDDDVKSRIFEPFFSTKKPNLGSGLGLATVYGVVKQHNGHITVYSSPGRGSSFKVYLPATDRRVEAMTPDSENAISDGRGECILLVEDEELVRRTLARSLKHAGYKLIVARDGQEALDAYEKRADDIDLLLTDVVMPQLDGPGLYARLLERQPDLRVIFISGYSEQAMIGREMGRNQIWYLPKPFTIARLSSVLREALNG